jgi:hypothetical protein
MTPYRVYDGRKRKWVSKGFLVINELYTEKEFMRMNINDLAFDLIELKKNQVKKYSDGSRYQKGVWF